VALILDTQQHRRNVVATALLWVITQRVVDSWPLKMGPIGCPETSGRYYHYPLRNNPEKRSCRLLRGGSLKSGTADKSLSLAIAFKGCILCAWRWYSCIETCQDKSFSIYIQLTSCIWFVQHTEYAYLVTNFTDLQLHIDFF